MSTTDNKKKSLVKSASQVSVATAFSRVLGLVREQVIAYYFGATLATDAFITAFRIPNLLRDMFAEGALSSAFVPVFKEKLVNESEETAFRLANIVFTAILIVVGLIVLLGIVAAPVLVFLMANGFVETAAKFDLTVDLTRIMMVYLLLVSLSALVMGVLNSFGRFGIPALSPAMFNMGTVVTVVVMHSYFGQPIYTLAIGVIIGGAGQLLIQLPSLSKIGYRFRPTFSFFDEGMKRIVKLFAPMIVGLSASRINILVSTLIASFLIEGSISYLNFSYRLMHFPLGVFAVALGTVALPNVSELVAKKEYNRLTGALCEMIGINFFLVIPSAIFLALMGDDLVRLIYQWGLFSSVDTENTALALRHYSYGLIGFAAIRVVVPFYYAFGDSKMPMKISVASVLLNVLLYYPLIYVLSFAGLAAATSIAGLFNFILLILFLPRKGVSVPFAKIGLNMFRMVVSAGGAFFLAELAPYKFMMNDTTVGGKALTLFVPAIVALVLYVFFCFLLRVEEVRLISRFILHRRK